jgi:gas vesicle protein
MTDQHIEQLRSDAAAHRQSIATDLELMGDRVSPGRIAERRKAKLRERVQGMRNTVFGSSERARTTGSYSSYVQAAPSPDRSQQHQGGESGQSVADRAGGAMDAVKDHTPDSLGEVTEGNPFGAAVVGFGIGMLAASLLPSSPDEQRAANKLQGTLDDTAADLGRSGKDAVDHVKPEAQQAVADVKDSAKDSVESVKSDAQHKADSVKGTAQHKTDEVRSQA